MRLGVGEGGNSVDNFYWVRMKEVIFLGDIEKLIRVRDD